MPVSAEDAQRVGEWSARVGADIEIRFQRTLDDRSALFEAYLDELRKLAPHVRIVLGNEGGDGPPAIILRENLRFQALPEGFELQPFLELLRAGAEPDPGDAADRPASPIQVEWPATIRIYVSPHCPHCPRAVSQIAPLAFENPRIDVTIIDGMLFPELATRDRIRSAPTVLLDETFRWTGVPPGEELMRALLDRDPSELSAESLKRMLTEGEAERLATMMVKHGRVFPGFEQLIDHPEWSVRLGAVVVMEELAEKSRELARMSLEPVWERFAGLDRSVKGDVVYLSGLVGPLDWAPRLEALRGEDASEDMREVVDEALENIRRHGAFADE